MIWMFIKGKLEKNWQVLQTQAEAAWEAIQLDVARGVEEFRTGDYASAIHSVTFGPPAEVCQHMWRWVFYTLIIYTLSRIFGGGLTIFEIVLGVWSVWATYCWYHWQKKFEKSQTISELRRRQLEDANNECHRLRTLQSGDTQSREIESATKDRTGRLD